MPPVIIAAGIGAAAGLGGAIMSSKASKSAANVQANAANNASQVQQAQYQQTRGDLAPYREGGQVGLNMLTSRIGDLSKPFQMSQANLEQTPGYQFNLSQGLKSVNNALGARGLLNSGAVMKGAGEYATGLADSTYGHQFDMYQQDQNNAYNKLMGVASLGENAAAQTGMFGTQTSHDIGQNMIGAGNAIAAGRVGSANAWSNGLNGIGSNALMAAMYGRGQSTGQYGQPVGIYSSAGRTL